MTDREDGGIKLCLSVFLREKMKCWNGRWHCPQDYIIDALLDKTITALPSPYVIFNIRKELRRFIELYGSDLSPYDEDLKQWMLKLIQCFDGKEKAKANTDEEPRQ